MKSIGGSLLTHIQSPESTLALCWKVTRKDATVLGFTSCDKDLVVSGVTYKSAGGSYTSSQIRSTADLSVDNLDLNVILETGAITEDDLIAGLYDYATVEIFQVNYNSIADGVVTLRYGTLGEIVTDGGKFKAELRGLTQLLQQVIGRSYSKRCDTDLGSSRCQVNLASYTTTGTVSTVTSRSVFTVSSAPTAPGGKFTFTSGPNNGLSMEVKSVSGATITLMLPMPYDIGVGNSYSVYRGCDKKPETCKTTFSNLVNFQGFPFIPGPDRALSYPDAK